MLVDITDADRKLRPKARWLPLENTPSGQVHIITMAHKFGLMTLTLRKVTIMAETLGTTPSLSVNILHMNRTIEYSEQPVRSESAAVRVGGRLPPPFLVGLWLMRAVWYVPLPPCRIGTKPSPSGLPSTRTHPAFCKL